MAKEYKLNIFDVLKNIDKKNYGYYNSLDNDMKNEIQPYTLTRWMSALSGNEDKHEKYTLDINNRLNCHFWELAKYKDLQWLLLCSCGQSGFNKHKWLALSKDSTDKTKKIIRSQYYDLSDDEFEIKYSQMSKDDINFILQNLGLKDK